MDSWVPALLSFFVFSVLFVVNFFLRLGVATLGGVRDGEVSTDFTDFRRLLKSISFFFLNLCPSAQSVDSFFFSIFSAYSAPREKPLETRRLFH